MTNPFQLSHLDSFEEERAIGPIQREEALFLFGLFRVTRPKVVVEFGFDRGRSASNFLAALDNDAIFYTYDITDAAAVAARSLSQDPRFHFIRKSQDNFECSDINSELIDFVFIDAAHDCDVNKRTFQLILSSLAPNAIIAVHDTGIWNKKYFLDKHVRFAKADPTGWLNAAEYQHQKGERAFVEYIINSFPEFNMVHFHSLRCLRHGLTIMQRNIRLTLA